MRIIHKIRNIDIGEETKLRKVFEKTSHIIDQYTIKNTLFVQKIFNKIIKIKIGFNVCGTEDTIIKIKIFFPERNYALEFIKEEIEYEIDFIYEMLREKEYFNIIVLNKYDLQILSTTYVFNDSNIIEYPILEKDYSKKKAKSQVILEENKISLVTYKEENDEDFTLIHTWQNIGQYFVYKQQLNESVYMTCMMREKMCAGIWMLIVTDNLGKLITQFLINVD